MIWFHEVSYRDLREALLQLIWTHRPPEADTTELCFGDGGLPIEKGMTPIAVQLHERVLTVRWEDLPGPAATQRPRMTP